MKIKNFYDGQKVETTTPLEVEVEGSNVQKVLVGTILKVVLVSLRHESKTIPGDGPNGFHIFAGYLKLVQNKVNPFGPKILPLLFIEEKEGMDFPFKPVKKA